MSEPKLNKNHSNVKSQDGSMIVEISIMIIISFCIIFLISFVSIKFKEYENAENAMLFVRDISEYNNDEVLLAGKMMEFRPDGYKMIEVYSEDFQPVFQVAFTNDDIDSLNKLTDHPDLVAILESEEYGHTSFELDDRRENIAFEWTESTDGNRYLIIIYMVRPIVEDTWVFSMVCYIILILVFTLILRMIFKKNRLYIQQYELLSKM